MNPILITKRALDDLLAGKLHYKIIDVEHNEVKWVGEPTFEVSASVWIEGFNHDHTAVILPLVPFEAKAEFDANYWGTRLMVNEYLEDDEISLNIDHCGVEVGLLPYSTQDERLQTNHSGATKQDLTKLIAYYLFYHNSDVIDLAEQIESKVDLSDYSLVDDEDRESFDDRCDGETSTEKDS